MLRDPSKIDEREKIGEREKTKVRKFPEGVQIADEKYYGIVYHERKEKRRRP
jgi:hypothetical protein